MIDAEDPMRTRLYTPARIEKLDRTPEPQKTQAVESVPRTNANTLKLGTDERPKVVVEDPTSFATRSQRELLPKAEPRRPPRFARLWPWLAIAVGFVGFLVGLASLLKVF